MTNSANKAERIVVPPQGFNRFAFILRIAKHMSVQVAMPKIKKGLLLYRISGFVRRIAALDPAARSLAKKHGPAGSSLGRVAQLDRDAI